MPGPQKGEAPLPRRRHEGAERGGAAAVERRRRWLAPRLQRELRIEAVLQLAAQRVHEARERRLIVVEVLAVEGAESSTEAEEQIVRDLLFAAEARAVEVILE